MDYSKMTEQELLEHRIDLVQELTGWTTASSGRHRSEIEYDIAAIDKELKRF